MSRAARKPKAHFELASMSMEDLNAEIKYLEIRKGVAGTSTVAKLFAKEIALAKRVRKSRQGA